MMTKPQMLCRRSLRITLATVAGSLLGFGAILPAASAGVTAAASNDALTISPASGSSISGTVTFTAPAPGCGNATNAVLRMKGPGITGDATGDPGFTNITAAVEVTPNAAISLASDGNTWDNIAINKSFPRPLNGTFTVKIQCLLDGEITGQPAFDRELAFKGTSNTWAVVGGGGATPTPSPTPTGTATPTPTPASDATPTPQPTAKPTPKPGGECDPSDEDSDEDCTETEGGADEDGKSAGGEGLPNSGGRDPSDAMTVAALLLFSGLLFLALTVEGPRPGHHREDAAP